LDARVCDAKAAAGDFRRGRSFDGKHSTGFSGDDEEAREAEARPIGADEA